VANIDIVTFRAPAMIPCLMNDINAPGNPVILVPQSFTLAVEKAILVRSSTRGMLGLQIYSPSSLIREINECAGQGSKKKITPDGRVMLISRILLDQEKNLKFYGRSVHQPGLPQRLAAQIDEFLGANLTPAAIKDKGDTTSTRNKLADIALIWEKYNEWCERGYVDNNADWMDALSRLPESGILKDAHLIIYGFDNITVNLRDLILTAQELARTITIGLIDDANSPDSAVFISTTNSIKNFLRFYKKAFEISLNPRFFHFAWEADPGIKYVEQSLFSLNDNLGPSIPDLEAVYMYYGRSSYQECAYTAQTLINWHRGGIPWSEMGVAVCEADTLPRLLPQVLKAAGIPCTVRIAQSVMTTDLAVFFQAIIHAMQNNWPQEDMLRIFRSGYIKLSSSELMDLENYVIEHGVNRSKWLKPFSAEAESGETLEAIRSSVMERLTVLKHNLTDRKCTGRHAAELLYNFLIEQGVYDHLLLEEETYLANNQSELIDLNRQVWKTILDVLDQLATFVESKHLALEDLSAMISASLASHQIKSLPQSVDTVIISQPSMFLADGIRAMAVVGFQQASAPLGNSLLSDIEKNCLCVDNFTVGFTREEMAARLKQDIYQVISLPIEHLLISCSASKPDGGILYPSQQFKDLARKVHRQYPDHVQGGMQSDGIKPFSPQYALESLAVRLRDAKDYGNSFLTSTDSTSNEWRQALSYIYNNPSWHLLTQSVLDSLNASMRTPGIRPEQADLLYPKSLSPSFAETAGTCPCQNWVQRGLLLQPRREFAFEMDQQGSFTHDVMNQYFRIAMADPAWPNISPAKVNRILNSILTISTKPWRDGPLGTDIVHKFKGAAIIRNLRTICEILTASAQMQPHFQPYAMEAGFGVFGDQRFPSICLVTPKGREVTLSGVIDRIDTMELQSGEKYFLVTDYKSSEKEMRWSSLGAGIQVQLPIYLYAVQQGLKGYNPAGGVFQPIREIVVETNPESVNNEIRKVARTQGIVLDDKTVQTGMDPLKVSKKSPTSDIIPVVSAEEMREMIQSALRITGSLIDLQFDGETIPSPLIEGDRAPCEYCMIHQACSRDPRIPGGQGRILIHKKPEILAPVFPDLDKKNR